MRNISIVMDPYSIDFKDFTVTRHLEFFFTIAHAILNKWMPLFDSLLEKYYCK